MLPNGYGVAHARHDMRTPIAEWLAAHTGDGHAIEVGDPIPMGRSSLTIHACACGATYGELTP